jgi:hypothetical protein
MKLRLLCATLVVGCSTPASEPTTAVAVEVPSAHEVASAEPIDRAPKGKGGFLSGIPFKSHSRRRNR